MANRLIRDDDVVIAAAVRTPVGSFLGELRQLSAPRLGGVVIAEVLARAGVAPADVSEVYMGHVLSAGGRQGPARQAAQRGGIPDRVGATAINKVCGSGLKSVMLAALTVASDPDAIVVAGGMESMSRAPFLAPDMRIGLRLGDGKLIDSLQADGLRDAGSDQAMGVFAERTASKYGISREQMDAFARQSYERAIEADASGAFDAERVAVRVGGAEVVRDEEPLRYQPEKLARLAPAFTRDGRITAANSSSINDGAAAVVVMSGRQAIERQITPLARVLAHAGAALAPEWFTTVTPKVVGGLMERTSLSLSDVDLFEINEAFAVVPILACRDLAVGVDRVNVHGGAVALGHPIGASGTRILVTLLHALQRTGGRIGVASICIGGGEGVGVMVENLAR